MAVNKRKKLAVLGVSSLILVVMVVAAVTIGRDKTRHQNQKDPSASKKAIESICQPTDYQETCVKTLSSAAGDTSDPEKLIRVAFEVTMDQIRAAANKSTVLEQLQKDPRTKAALQSCHELADLAVNDLERSFNKLKGLDISVAINQMLADMKIWLSGAITYQETCLDGFEDAGGEAGEKMRETLKSSMQLTSNALAMVTEISSVLAADEFSKRRRLLSLGGDEFPEWFNDEGKRRLLNSNPTEIKADIIVAKDGSGKYKTINEALVDIPKHGNNTFVMYIKEGVYEEKVQFNSSMTHLMVIGDGPTKTRITGKLNFIDGVSTFRTATVAVLADYFIAKDIGFENSAGPEKHQAVALRVGADMSMFHNCHMDGHQDTLYAHTYRQFYRDCVISGTIDFIFGDSAAIFQSCTLLIRKPLDNQQCIVTAHGRKDVRQPTGLVLQNCTISPHPSYIPVKTMHKSYLARPWKEFSRTIIMESFIDDLIQPQGWLPWNATFALETLFYTEFNNRGPGASKVQRERWPGVKELTTPRIQHFTSAQFIEGDTWIPSTGVPYAPGLMFPPPVDNETAASPYSPEEDIDIQHRKKKKSYSSRPDLESESVTNEAESPAPTISPAVPLASNVVAPPPTTSTVVPVMSNVVTPAPSPAFNFVLIGQKLGLTWK